MNKEELKNNIKSAIQLIGVTLASFNLILGYNLKDNKAVLMDVDTHKFSMFDLEELNKEIIRIKNKNK